MGGGASSPKASDAKKQSGQVEKETKKEDKNVNEKEKVKSGTQVAKHSVGNTKQKKVSALS